jgi:hypothetical protein
MPQLSNAIEVTISDVKRFKQCRRAWDFNSTLRQNLVPKFRAIHFVFGDLFHRALEEFYMRQVQPDVWFQEEASKYLATLDVRAVPRYEVLIETIAMGPPLLRLYVQWAKEHDDFKVVSMEERLTLRLNNQTPGHFFSFKYDMLVNRNGKLWIHDFKTTQQMESNFDWLAQDDQAAAYQWAYEQATGQKIEGVFFTFIKKQMPVLPRVLKSGEISRSLSAGMTVESYLSVIKEIGAEVAHYQSELAQLEKRQFEKFIVRAEARASTLQKQVMGAQLRELAKIMADPELYIYPSPDKQRCRACDFREPCTMVSAGLSPDAMLKTGFMQADPRG